MENQDAPFYVSVAHVDALEAVRMLGESGLDVKRLSLVGKDYHCESHPVGFYMVGGRIKSWTGFEVMGGASSVGAALAQIGIPSSEVSKYQTALEADKCVLAVHGSAEDVVKARCVLANSDTWKTAQ
jgi:hypothetical protein